MCGNVLTIWSCSHRAISGVRSCGKMTCLGPTPSQEVRNYAETNCYDCETRAAMARWEELQEQLRAQEEATARALAGAGPSKAGKRKRPEET